MTITLPVQSLFQVPGPSLPPWQNMGWEVQSPQPPSKPRRRLTGWPHFRDIASYKQFSWVNAGSEVQPPQPPARPRRLIGWPDFNEDGTEAPFVPPTPAISFVEGVFQRTLKTRPRKLVGWSDWNDDGTPTLSRWVNAGWEVQSPQPPRRLWERSYAGIRFKSEFPIFLGLGSYGFENQAWQPPHKPMQRIVGWPDFGDDGNYAPFVPTIVTFKLFDGVFQRTLKIRPRRLVGWSDFNDDGNQQPLPWLNAGWEVQSLQPPARFRRLFGWSDWNDDGVPASPWTYMGFEVQPPQPPRPKRIMVGWSDFNDDGNQQPFPWLNDGWEVQSVQPPARFRRLFGWPDWGDDGNEAPFVPTVTVPILFESTPTVYKRSYRITAIQAKSEFAAFNLPPMLWDIQPTQPPHPRPEKSGSIMVGDQGDEATFVFVTVTVPLGHDSPPVIYKFFRRPVPTNNEFQPPLIQFLPVGWEVQSPQPPHPRPEKWSATIHEDDGIEATFAQFFPQGWPVQPWQPPHPRPERGGSIMRGDDGNQNIFTFAITPISWGYEPFWQPPHTKFNRAGSIKFKSEFPIFATLGSYGFENQAWQPPRRNWNKISAMVQMNREQRQLIQFQPYGWEIQPPPPPRRKWERWAGTIKEDDGNEGTFIPFFVPLTNGWPIQEWQPPHPRREKAGSIMPSSFIEVVKQNFFPFGWPVQPPPPPRRKWEKAAAIMPISFIDSVKINFFNYGWPIQPWQPPHPRREKAGAIMPNEDGIERPFIFVAQVVIWGYEPNSVVLKKKIINIPLSSFDIPNIFSQVTAESLVETVSATDLIDASILINEALIELASVTDLVDAVIVPVPPRPAPVQNIYAGLIPGEAVPSASSLIIPRNVFDYPVPDLPSALFIQIPPETGPVTQPIRLRITRPDGTQYNNLGLFAFATTVRTQRYVVYYTDTNEIDQVGWWIVEWTSGPYTSGQSAFYIVDPSRSLPSLH